MPSSLFYNNICKLELARRKRFLPGLARLGRSGTRLVQNCPDGPRVLADRTVHGESCRNFLLDRKTVRTVRDHQFSLNVTFYALWQCCQGTCLMNYSFGTKFHFSELDRNLVPKVPSKTAPELSSKNVELVQGT